MTGFARRERQFPWGLLAWELKTVNHRFLEVGCRLPEEFRAAEADFRQAISGAVRRGKVESSLHFRPAVALMSAALDAGVRVYLYCIDDAVQAVVNHDGFAVAVSKYGDGDEVLVEPSDSAALAAYMLKYQRETHGLSLADVAKKLGASRRTAYARYEQGDVAPSIDKLNELLAAVAPDMALIVGLRKPARSAPSSAAPTRKRTTRTHGVR